MSFDLDKVNREALRLLGWVREPGVGSLGGAWFGPHGEGDPPDPLDSLDACIPLMIRYEVSLDFEASWGGAGRDFVAETMPWSAMAHKDGVWTDGIVRGSKQGRSYSHETPAMAVLFAVFAAEGMAVEEFEYGPDDRPQ